MSRTAMGKEQHYRKMPARMPAENDLFDGNHPTEIVPAEKDLAGLETVR